MSRVLVLRNRQRTRPVDGRLLRRITRQLLVGHLQVTKFELGLHLVATGEMAGLNETFLGHEGSTDVITFDHAETGVGQAALHGEIFICLDEAVAQARLFRTTWPAELVRYVIHGLLHLRGFDDLEPNLRRKMKREENRLLRAVRREFRLSQLARTKPGCSQSAANHPS